MVDIHEPSNPGQRRQSFRESSECLQSLDLRSLLEIFHPFFVDLLGPSGAKDSGFRQEIGERADDAVSEGKSLPRIWMPAGVKRNRFHPDDRVRATLSTCGRDACTYLQQIPFFLGLLA